MTLLWRNLLLDRIEVETTMEVTTKGNLNSNQKLIGLLATALAGASLFAPCVRAAETNAAPGRIGVYDSRMIAYAHFWTDAHQRDLNERVKAAKEAKAAGQTDRYRELTAALKKEQEQNHLQVFSTAPVDDVLAAMKERVAAVQQEAGVARLVSKWDDQTLSAFRRTTQVDVTDSLLRDFKLTDKQKKVIADLRKQKPLPLEKAQELLRKGEL